MRRLRTVGLAAALAALVLVPLAIWAATSLSDEEKPEALQIQTYPGPLPQVAEMVVALPSEELNTLDTTGGTPSVGLECLDADGRAQLRVEHPFPFTDTDGGVEPPHLHQRVSVEQLARIERCRLDGTDPPLEGVPD